jgi:short-chain 2-methylacyl-CoA dehydrogenase
LTIQSQRAAGTAAIDVPWCLTDEQVAWGDAVARFAARVVAPVAGENFIAERFPEELVPEFAKLGLFGIRIPAKYGGADAGVTDLIVAVEQLARVDGSTAGTVHLQAINSAFLAQIGTEEQVGDIIPRAVRGESFIAVAITEPSGGSNARNMRTVARRDGGDWLINGAKQFISNAGTPYSEWVILMAVTGGAGEPKPEISAFLVPLNAPGVEVGPGYKKLGFRSSDTRQLFFEDVRVPASALLGEQGTGYRRALELLSWARISAAATATGLAQGCLDATLRFVHERESFGVRLGQHQYVAFACADLAAMTATCRLLTYDASWRADHDLPYEREASIAKYMTTELANKVAYLATQLHGGDGYMLDSPVARHFADLRLQTIIEGTSEMQRLIIARSLGL